MTIFLSKDGPKGFSLTGTSTYVGEVTLPIQRPLILPALEKLAKRYFQKFLNKNCYYLI